ncbi:MAG: nicotinamide-nucleotide adenylyltransferase, partial [Candidatus Methanofastidiosia archaeon]
MRALYIGRFQPFHKGHLEVVRYVLNQVEEIIIAIGSAQDSYTSQNPFTAGERFEMIRTSLCEEAFDINKIFIVPVEDIKRNSVWVSHVESLVPSFDVVYSNEPLNILLFEKKGYEVRNTPMFSRKEYSSTNIRLAILGGKIWEDLVPRGTKTVIERIGGMERIARINSTD